MNEEADAPRLPNADQAWVPDDKITRYVLNLEHPKGKDRARFLLRFGFVVEDPDKLAEALLIQAQTGEASQRNATEYGVIWNVVGALPSPDGRNPVVTTGWIIRPSDPRPQFTTLTLKRAGKG